MKKKKISKLSEKTIAIIMVLSLLINNFAPLIEVFAQTVSNYTITFSAQGNHTMEVENGRLKIDGQYVELRNDSDNSVGEASCSDNKSCEIRNITETGKLNYGGNNFSLFNTDGHTKITYDTEFSSSQVLFVEDFEDNNNGGENNNNNNSTNITFQLDGATVSGNVITFDVNGTNITATVSGTGYSFNGNNLIIEYSKINDVKLTLSNNYNKNEMNVQLHTGQVLSVNDNNEVTFGGINYSDNSPHLGIVQNGHGNNGGDNTQNHHGNAAATLNYKVDGVIEYNEESGFEEGVSFQINGTPYMRDNSKTTFSEDTAYERDENGQIILNDEGQPIPINDPETGQPIRERTGVTITGDTINYSYDTNTNKVKFTFITSPGTVITGIKINGQVINNLPRTKEALARCYTDHRIEIDVDNIDKADEYNIEITARYPNEDEEFLGNFLWDYNPQGYTSSEDKILNATLTFVEAEYNGVKYTTEEEINNLGGVFIWRDAERKKKYTEEREGVGEAQFPTGTKLTVKIVPDAGYQLIDFGINGGVFETQDEIGTYTFEVKGGPFHLQARVEQVEDVVNTKSEKIKSGNITLGGAEDSMSKGTARLDVDDITLTKEQISNFKTAAEGYDIKNYLDISLFNTVFKGSETDSWDTQVAELNNEATITLKLEDDVDGNEIVIVHEKHDGTYEIIPVTYDENAHTISFKTKSFSNYALASKGFKTTTLNTNPKTIDNIRMYINLFIISFGGIAITLLKLKKRKKY